MPTLLLLPLLLLLAAQPQNSTPPKETAGAKDAPLIAVVSFKWSRIRKTVKGEPEGVTPAREMIADNKTYQRNARINQPVGQRDPNEDTIDGRSAAIEKIVQESRTQPPKSLDTFSYEAKIQNGSKKTIDVVFWEYQFIDQASPLSTTRRQFLCGAGIKPGKEKDLQASSLSGPSDVVSVDTLANGSGKRFLEMVLINRVEYADGSIWERKGWKFSEIRLALKRALATAWTENCRAL
ncbi:MAG TPA: hypothetical protein DC047_20495 [Blastocatellia bacterium]|nr:hypothetical protein [Blastocatellia bacterium]